MSNIHTMIQSAKSSNPTGFARAFTTELRDRLGSALAERRAEVVGSMFGEEADPDQGEKDRENASLKNKPKSPEDDTVVKEAAEKMCACGKMPKGKCNCDKKDM